MQLIIILLIYVQIKSYETNNLRRAHEVLYSYNCAKKCEGKSLKSLSNSLKYSGDPKPSRINVDFTFKCFLKMCLFIKSSRLIYFSVFIIIFNILMLKIKNNK